MIYLGSRPSSMIFSHQKSFAHLKKSIIQEQGDQCEECKDRQGYILHHKHYDSWGEEKRHDVLLLCGFCHNLIHGKNPGLI